MSNPHSCPTPNGLAVTSNPAGQPYLDELTPIAEYMAREISTNLRSRDVQAMKHLNHSADYFLNHAQELKSWGLGELLDWGKDKAKGLTAREAAMMIWTMKVAQDSSWDHKPVIRHCFHPRDPQHQEYHAWKDRRYFYDIWSNIHYGFIGAAAGFTPSQLLDGAGLEQIGSDLFRLHMPGRKGSTGRLRDFDDHDDRTAIQLGIDLYRKSPGGPTATTLVTSIINSSLTYRT
ncbi:polymorphic toxin type 44 domain-containing protein [Pokkaliibacter plantistimulans]|uniref:polymorphic toxin type 44 domain-containing protein n=1 Tax=Pokkaliibacter plantistimulans TaxID=1635171 RepID=UPI0014026ECD|nr:polymorphic toxin type 44 domain-containing protein [Pokkaliibacter plantistimulans]